MKALAVVIPQAGHLNPMLPLLGSLLAGGDEVVVATGPDVRDQVTRLGAAYRQAGGGFEKWFGELAARVRGIPGDGLPPERIPYYFVPRLFAEIAASDMIDGALAAARELQPDMVLFDSCGFAGPLVAASVDAVPAHHSFGPLIPDDVLDLCADALSPLWRSFGRERPPYAGLYDGATVTICPPALDHRMPSAGESLRLRPAPPPQRSPQPQSPPLVYLTFGTMWADAALVRTALDALAGMDVRVLATLGRLDPGDIGGVPSNAQVEVFVPQADILPDCSLVVDHAGAGTTFGALAHGLPQVLLPQAADNFVNADLIHRAGAGIAITPADVSEEAVADAVMRALTEPSYRAAAASIAGEIAALPSPDELASQLRARAAAAR